MYLFDETGYMGFEISVCTNEVYVHSLILRESRCTTYILASISVIDKDRCMVFINAVTKGSTK